MSLSPPFASGHASPLDPATTPDSIEQRSFAIIDAEIPVPRPFDGPLWHLARRLIHTSGDPTILPQLSLSTAAVQAGIDALRSGCTVFTDTEMARCGMTARHLGPLHVSTTCILSLPHVAEQAHIHQCTRSRAGILCIAPLWHKAIIAIGNAPTALLALLECLDAGAPPPALIIGMPVGFVNAAESKALLARSPYLQLSLQGRKGGSNLAAATVNALATLAKV
ncbi:MAG: precorrin-8X methylmutase [Desulfovibrionaceae bacterium]